MRINFFWNNILFKRVRLSLEVYLYALKHIQAFETMGISLTFSIWSIGLSIIQHNWWVFGGWKYLFPDCLVSEVYMPLFSTDTVRGLEEPRQRPIRFLRSERYDTIVNLVLGKFKIPHRQRNREQQNAYLQHWRNKDKFEYKDGNLYHMGQKVFRH